ncbi:MAG: hypothetical protein JOZ39_07830 [Chloroflexi bacterium]|nr:hypothetical protein [Chloroflexota bacterium]
MSIAALNRWRWVFLGWCVLAGALHGIAVLKPPLLGGALLWLLHDLAHGRWRQAFFDGCSLTVALACRNQRPASMAIAAAVLPALVDPEREPSLHLWSAARRRSGA